MGSSQGDAEGIIGTFIVLAVASASGRPWLLGTFKAPLFSEKTKLAGVEFLASHQIQQGPLVGLP